MADVIVWDNGAVTFAGPGFNAVGLVEEWHRDHPNVETKPYDIVPEELVDDHPYVKPLRDAEKAKPEPVTLQDVIGVLEGESPGRATAMQALANGRKSNGGD